MISAPPADKAPRPPRTARAPRKAGGRAARTFGPFTLPHFRSWALDLVLDSGLPWALEDFQEAFIEDVFTGCPECWLVVPEGNGKTTLIAGLALYHCEFRPQASVPIAASSREQAEIMYRQAEGFVFRTPRLHRLETSTLQLVKGKRKTELPRFVCLEGYRRINHIGGGRIQVFAADDRTGDGVIPTLGIIDELHRHRDLSLYRTWSGKLLKRQGQIVTISTAGEPGSDFELTRERIRQTAEKVTRRGSFVRAQATRTILHEWAVPEGADVSDIDVVKTANPFTGVTREALLEKRATPTMTEAHWRRFVCNLPTRSENAAIQEAEWDAAQTTDEIPPGESIWLGLDVAWKWDTTAAVPYWWRGPSDRLLGPASILEPPRDGTSLDPAKVEIELARIHARNPIHTVVMDTSRAEQLASWIEATLGATVIDWPQGNAFATKEYDRFMEALRLGAMRHSGDRGLRTHVLNAIAQMLPGGQTRFDRPSQSRASSEQGRRVIDALKAAAMVNCAAVDANAQPPTPKVEFVVL